MILPKSREDVFVIWSKFKGPKSMGLWMNLHGEQRASRRMRVFALAQNRANSMEEVPTEKLILLLHLLSLEEKK